MEKKYNIRKFEIDYIADNSSILIIAKRGSGKSWLCRDIILNISKYIPVGIVISPTEELNAFYKKFIPDTFIYYNYDSDILRRLFERQEYLINHEKETGKKYNKRCFLVMDDCLALRKDWIKDPEILKLLMNGRHYNITYILTMQYSLGIGPELRNQFDYIFLFAEDFITNMERLYKHYTGMFETFESFKQIFTQITANYGCMVIVNTNRSPKIKIDPDDPFSKIFWYRASNINITKPVGIDQYIKYHEKHYNEEWKNKKQKKAYKYKAVMIN